MKPIQTPGFEPRKFSFPGGDVNGDSSDEELHSQLSSHYEVSSMASDFPKVRRFRFNKGKIDDSESSSEIEVLSDKDFIEVGIQTEKNDSYAALTPLKKVHAQEAQTDIACRHGKFYIAQTDLKTRGSSTSSEMAFD